MPCEPGYYQDGSGIECLPCPAGSYCQSTSAKQDISGTTTWAPALSTYERQVQPGYAWVSTSVEPVKCGKGTYWDASTKTCPGCSKGKFCPVDGNDFVGSAELDCPAGFFTDQTNMAEC